MKIMKSFNFFKLSYFFGTLGGLAYLFIFFDLLLNEHKQLFKGTFIIYLTIEIFCFGLGYRSLNKKMNSFQKTHSMFESIKHIFMRVVNILKKPFKSDSKFNLANYIIAILIGTILFFTLSSNLDGNISVRIISLFYVFQMSYLVFFVIMILNEINILKKNKNSYD
jgi:hypothetical protein